MGNIKATVVCSCLDLYYTLFFNFNLNFSWGNMFSFKNKQMVRQCSSVLNSQQTIQSILFYFILL